MKAIYAGVILTPGAQQELREWFAGLSPLREKGLAHHLTWAFKPTSDEVRNLPIGQPVTLKVVGYVDREGIQAVVVEGAETRNAIAHVTVAVDQGVSPVRSNDVLAAGYTPVVGPALAGKWGWFDGKGDQFTLPVE
jgi:hypothetical protein